MFILLYGVQVLRGVMEEKTNRIVEVMVSSVRPFQLMMGKIIGIALVGLTQFLVWMTLSGLTITIVGSMMAPDVMQQVQSGNLQTQQEMGGVNIGQFLDTMMSLRLPLILVTFVFYFLTGYLLYSALFAAVGSAIDSESDSQQFMLPITIPLVFSIAIGQFVLNNPTGTLATVFSFIPFTAPVVMMVRIPFGIPWWEVGVSAGMMIVGFIGTTWLAAKIYRTGILMYGKKPTYKELFKWLFYKN
jgi:ABC-2 type transport system permease protein